jgi:hypothetical protein
MAVENGKNPGRPYDMAVSDYCRTGNDLIWKKHMGDQEKPKYWDIGISTWYINPKKKRRW